MEVVNDDFCLEDLFTQCEMRARDEGCKELLSCFNRDVLGHILQAQLRRTGGNIFESVLSTTRKLKEIELGVKALHEHHLRMDKGHFEMLVKSDSFLVRGRQKGTGNPLMWLRVGFPKLDGWKTALARAIVDGLYKPSGGKEMFVIMDFVCPVHPTVMHIMPIEIHTERLPNFFLFRVAIIDFEKSTLGISEFNFKVTENVIGLVDEIFGPLQGAQAFAGVSSFARVILIVAKGIYPKSVSDRWIVLNGKEDIFDIVDDKRDIPHWWSESTANIGAHRDPTDPREYWCWTRCLSEENPITVRDFYSPDPETWLDGCDTHAGSTTLPALPSSISIRTSGQGEKEAHRSDFVDDNMINGKPHRQSIQIDSMSALEVIEECDEGDD